MLKTELIQRIAGMNPHLRVRDAEKIVNTIFEEMIAAKMTFDAAIRNGRFSLMAKQRLKIVRDHLFDQLDALKLVAGVKPELAGAGATQG